MEVLMIDTSTPTLLSALRLGQLIQEVGFPAGVINIVPGFGKVAGQALVNHPLVDKIAFTGSTAVGKQIVQSAAGNLKRLTLELGGKSPNIIFDDADLSLAIPGAMQAIFTNSGQWCQAGSRLFVQRGVYDAVAGALAQAAGSLKIGPGLDPETVIGPLVSQQQLDRVTGYISSGFAQGARPLTGGERHGEIGYFVQPTVLVDTQPDMKIIREEIFGPVLAIIPFSDTDEVIRAANDTAYGLAAAVWTGDSKKAHRVSRALKAGTIWVNCYGVGGPELPLGGYKQSGWGREGGKEILDAYTELKTISTGV